MTTLREAAPQILDALESYRNMMLAEAGCRFKEGEAAIAALRAALAQEEQEPVAWMYVGIKHDGTTHGPHLVWKPQYMDSMSAEKGAKATPLYTAPPRREWQGLTEEEIEDMSVNGTNSELRRRQFARDIEAALKEKNHG